MEQQSEEINTLEKPLEKNSNFPRRFRLLTNVKRPELKITDQNINRYHSDRVSSDKFKNISEILRCRKSLRTLTNKYYNLYVSENKEVSLKNVKLMVEDLINEFGLQIWNVSAVYQYLQDQYKPNAHLNYESFYYLVFTIFKIIEQHSIAKNKLRVMRKNFVFEMKLASVDELEKFYRFDRRLGKGSFGEIDRTGFKRVCKIIDLSKAVIPNNCIETEIQILKHLDHPNIIKIFEVYQGKNHIYIIMEYCEGGELGIRITEALHSGVILTEQYIADIMRQLLEAINYFHTQNVIHKDLKPENILFRTMDSNNLKVIDFGLAEMFERSDGSSNIAAGTFLYMAPEIFEYIVTHKCDVWSAGCILFQLFVGDVLYPLCSTRKLSRIIRNEPVPFEKLDKLPISTDAINLLKHMLDKNHISRYSAQECLLHPWMSAAKQNTELSKSMCLNLKRFKQQSTLKKVLKNILAHQLDIYGPQLIHVANTFRSLDLNGNGCLSKNEMIYGLMTHGFSSQEVLDIILTDGVSYNEFLAACYKWKEIELNIFWGLFQKLNKNNDGKISVDEFINMLIGSKKDALNFNISSNLKTLQENVLKIDTDKDGYISWDEFLEYMK